MCTSIPLSDDTRNVLIFISSPFLLSVSHLQFRRKTKTCQHSRIWARTGIQMSCRKISSCTRLWWSKFKLLVPWVVSWFIAFRKATSWKSSQLISIQVSRKQTEQTERPNRKILSFSKQKFCVSCHRYNLFTKSRNNRRSRRKSGEKLFGIFNV